MTTARTAPAAIFSCLLAACAQTPPVPQTMGEAPSSLSARDAYPTLSLALDGARESATHRFRVTDGDDAGKGGRRVVEPASEGGATVAWFIEGEEEPRTLNEVERAGDGAILVTRMPNRERDVVTRFEPPFVHFPTELHIDEPTEQDVEMLIADFEAPDTITRTGQGVSTITLLGVAGVVVDGDRAEAVVVRAELLSTFGPARVRRITDRWFLEGEGFVGERFENTVRVFGIETERRVREIWREGVEPAPENGASAQDS